MYASLIRLKQFYLNLYSQQDTLGGIRIAEAKLRRLQLLDAVYFLFLIDRTHTMKSAKDITDLVTDRIQTEYLKKLNQDERESFFEDILEYLIKLNCVKKDRNRYYAADMETPYISKSSLNLSRPESQYGGRFHSI